MQQRPNGVTILAVLVFIGGTVFLLVGGWFLITKGADFISGDALHGGMGAIGGVAGILLAVFLLKYGVGLWRLRPWAWSVSLAVAIMLAGIGLVRVASSVLLRFVSISGLGSDLVFLVLSGIMFWYLLRPTTKMAFGRK